MTAVFQRILVPLQFDDGSLAALRLAKDLAIRNHANLILLHVIPLRDAALSGQRLRSVEHPADTETWMEGEARSKLEAAALEVLGSEVPYSAVTRVGDPTAEILRAEKELGIDLVVMATHGRKGVWRVVLGSVVEKVVRSSTCPVLTMAPETGP